MTHQKYFIAVVSKEHTLRGVEGGFMQVCHGKQAPLKRMKKDDWVIFYSSKQTMNGIEKCQAFTAIGRAEDDLVFPFQMSSNFIPFRRKVKFYPCSEVSILPLIEELEFIPNKKTWGFPFRFGFLEIREHDFDIISSKMLKLEIVI